jgi:hypothetical protein
MNRPNTKAAMAERPNRMNVVLAAGWLILSLAIGGVLWTESPAQASSPSHLTETASQP